MRFLMVLFAMIFLHCFADYTLQGCLADLKQKRWWIKETHGIPKYANDYKMALAVHSFEWSFMIMLPALIFMFVTQTTFSWHGLIETLVYMLMLAANTLFHYTIDDMKANDRTINLVQDQLWHLGQIGLTWIFWTVFFGW